MRKSHTGQRELRIWSESMTGKRDLHMKAETAEIWKKVALILERQGCQRVSGHAQQQQTSDNQTPPKLTNCVASTHGQVRIPRKPSK